MNGCLLPPLDEQADVGVCVAEGVEDGGSFDVAAVDVVHPQDAIVDTEKKRFYYLHRKEYLITFSNTHSNQV